MSRSTVPFWVSDEDSTLVEGFLEEAEQVLDDLNDALAGELKALGADPERPSSESGDFGEHPSTRGVSVADANSELPFVFQGESYLATLIVNYAVAGDGSFSDRASWLYGFIDSPHDTLAELELNGIKRWKTFASDLVKEFVMNHSRGRRASASRIVRRFLASDRITVRDLEEIGGNMLEGDEDLEGLAKKLQRVGGRDADNVLQDADEVLKTFGVEAIWEEGEYSNPAAIYLNTGDSYSLTLVFDYEEDELLLTTWGDWVEGFDREYGNEGRSIRASTRTALKRLDPMIQKWVDHSAEPDLALVIAHAAMVHLDPSDRRLDAAVDEMSDAFDEAYARALQKELPLVIEDWEAEGEEVSEVYSRKRYDIEVTHPEEVLGVGYVGLYPDIPQALVMGARKAGISLDPKVVKTMVARDALKDLVEFQLEDSKSEVEDLGGNDFDVDPPYDLLDDVTYESDDVREPRDYATASFFKDQVDDPTILGVEGEIDLKTGLSITFEVGLEVGAFGL